MTQIALEQLLDKAEGSTYKLVIISARRALEIAEGAPKLVSADSNAKATKIALQEIAADKVRYKKLKKEKKK